MDVIIQNIVMGEAANKAHDAVTAVLTALHQGSLTVLQLVGLLQVPLTDDDNHDARANAVQLLSQVAADAPTSLKTGDVGVLADFLGSKLSDWRCVTAAVPGCLALLQRYRQPALAPLPVEAATKLVGKLIKLHVQGLDYKGRMSCYQVLLEVLQGPFAVPTVIGGADLVYFMIIAMENEADPRCLLLALQCVKAVASLYQKQELSHTSHLQDNIEDLFDACVAPYFPILFNAPKSGTHNISRDMLLQHVVTAMACCPEFAPLAIPVLSEKLGSNLKQAKEDSLTALPVCCRAWGSAAVKPHLQAVWLMLKSELMAPAAVAAEDQPQPEQLAAKVSMALKAAAALQASTKALGPGLLDQQVLNDVALEDLMQYLGLVDPPWAPRAGAAGVGGGGAGGSEISTKDVPQDTWHLPVRAQKRMACIANCVAAVVGAGGDSTSAACSAVLRPAIDAVQRDLSVVKVSEAAAGSATQADNQPSRPLQAHCSVLCVVHECIQAVAAADADGQAADNGSFAALQALLPLVMDILYNLQQLLNQSRRSTQLYQDETQQQQHALESSSTNTEAPQVAATQDPQQLAQLQLWILLLWQDLLTLRPVSAHFTDLQLCFMAQQLLDSALHGSSMNTQLELSLLPSPTEQEAAVRALASFARCVGSPDGSCSPVMGAQQQNDYAHVLSGCIKQLLQLMQRPYKHPAEPAVGEAHVAAPYAAARQVDVMSGRAADLLGALAGSCAAASWLVLKQLHPHVVHAVQEGLWFNLTKMLQLCNQDVVVALPANFTVESSDEAMAFCCAFVDAWQRQQPPQTKAFGTTAAGSTCITADSKSQWSQEAVTQSCVLVAQLTSRCQLEDQRRLLLPVCAWVGSIASGPHMVGEGAVSSGPVCIALAVLAAARPGLLGASSTMDLLRAAAAIAVNTENVSSSSAVDRLAAAVASGAMINKSLGWARHVDSNQADAGMTVAAVPPAELLDAALAAMALPLHQQQECSSLCNDDAQAALCAALGWVARGLAMQRHDGWQDIMRKYVLPVLQSCGSSQSPRHAADAPHEASSPGSLAVHGMKLMAAAEFFAVLIAPLQPQARPTTSTSMVQYTGLDCSAGTCVNSSKATAMHEQTSLGTLMSMHNMTRPLWQQKTFVFALEALQGAVGVSLQQQVSQKPAHVYVWVAIASLLSSAPAEIVAPVQQQPDLLLQCVRHLLQLWQGGKLHSTVDSTCSSGSRTSASHDGLCVSAEQQVYVLQLLSRCLLLLQTSLSPGGRFPPDLGTSLAPEVETMLTTLCRLVNLQVGKPTACLTTLQQEQQPDGLGVEQSWQQLAHLATCIREAALLCLTACIKRLPYHLLHPHRCHVEAAVVLALDDNRRAVRKAAVVCRAAWSS